MIYKSYLLEKNFDNLKERLVLFYGENNGLKDDFKKILRSNKNVEIINLLQNEILQNEESFLNEIFNLSLFETEKVIFINYASDKVLPIIERIEKEEQHKIYLFSEVLDKKSKLRNYFEKSKKTAAVPCYADNELTIKNLILNRLKNFKNLTTQNINLIVESTSLDRVKMNNELDKINNLFTNKELNSQKLENLLNTKENNDFNLLKDEALIGNKSNTNKLISETILETEKNILFLSLINQRLLKLADLNKLKNEKTLEEALNSLKPPIFWKDKPKFLSQAKKWNLKKIKEALNKVYEIEIKMKTNSYINPNILLKKLILDLCILANS
tara:strand:+ start:3449 stop:4432 length:984 start_codon:yes stop_codon:yes gene_type:complete